MNLKAMLLGAAVAVAAPFAAGAVTVAPNDSGYFFFSDETFGALEFTSDSPVLITFTIGGSSPSRAAVDALQFGFADSPDADVSLEFTTITGTGVASGARDPFTVALTGAPGYFIIEDAAPGVVTGSVSFEVSAVPLPAAGWVFLSALGGLGVLARKRKPA